MKHIEAMNLALEALEVATTPFARDRQEVLRAQAALREALAAPVQDEAWQAQQKANADYAIKCATEALEGVTAQQQEPVDVAAFVEGMEVSIDVSTGDHDSGNRLFGTVTLVQENQGSKHGLILLVQDPEANFKTATPQPAQQEPVAWTWDTKSQHDGFLDAHFQFSKPESSLRIMNLRPLYAAPQPSPVQEPVAKMGMYEHKCPDVTGHRGPSFVCQKAGHGVGQNSYCNVCTCPEALNTSPQPAQQQQEPVAWMEMVVANLVREGVNKHKARELAQHFYTSPPAQHIPDAIHHTDLSEHPEYISGWNDCRQAMIGNT